MTNDKVPEERKPEYAELIKMLHQAYGKPLRVPSERQAQALARARERLGFTEPESPHVAPLESSPIDFEGVRINEEPEPHQHGFLRLISLIAAALVVGALIVSSLLVFQVHQPTTAPLASPIGPVGQPVLAARTAANGFVSTLSVTPGPYFVGEVLEMQFSITNHTPNFYWLGIGSGGFSSWSCAPTLSNELPVTMAGGVNDAALRVNLSMFSACGWSGNSSTELSPNQTASRQGYIVLTASGHIILATKLRLTEWGSGATGDPFVGHWPSVQINVQTRIPSNRLIAGQQSDAGMQVIITAPPLARSQLVYTYLVRCIHGQEDEEAMKLNTLTLQPPPCPSLPPGVPGPAPGKFKLWVYVVGAPGYSVVVGSVKG